MASTSSKRATQKHLKAFDRLEIVTDFDNAETNCHSRPPPGFEHTTRIGMGWRITGVCEHPTQRQKSYVIWFDAWSNNSFQSRAPTSRTDRGEQFIVKDIPRPSSEYSEYTGNGGTVENDKDDETDAVYDHFTVLTNKDELMEERIGVCKVKNKGLVIFCPCAVTRITRVVNTAIETTGESRVYAIVGGFLFESLFFKRVSPEWWRLRLVTETLEQWGVEMIIVGSSTGKTVIEELLDEMPGIVWLSYAGATFTIGDSRNAVIPEGNSPGKSSGYGRHYSVREMPSDRTFVETPTVLPHNIDNIISRQESGKDVGRRTSAPPCLESIPDSTKSPPHASPGYNPNADLRQRERKGTNNWNAVSELIEETNAGLREPSRRVWPLKVEYDRVSVEQSMTPSNVKPGLKNSKAVPSSQREDECIAKWLSKWLFDLDPQDNARQSDHSEPNLGSRRQSSKSNETLIESEIKGSLD